MLRAALAEKVLHGWAQNRQQVAVPLSLNLGRMEAAPRGLLLAAMAAARVACGEQARPRMEAVLARLGADPLELPAVPPDLFRLLDAIEAAGLGAHAFAASSMALDPRGKLARAWLDYLAARFALPPAMLAGLARRYRA